MIMRNLWIKLIASAVLSSGYLLILWLILHPRTSEEYRDHYLTRTSDCWYAAPSGTPADPSDTIDFSGIPDREACRFLRYGWASATQRGSEARLTTLTLRIPFKPGVTAIQLEFSQPPVHAEEADISLVGGSNRPTVHVGPQPQPEVTIPVDTSSVNDNQWLFQFVVDDGSASKVHQTNLDPGVRHIALKAIHYLR
jgi:hypothetical protein